MHASGLDDESGPGRFLCRVSRRQILTEGWVKQVNIADPRRTRSVDWTNILKRPFRSTLTRTDPNGTESTFPRFVRFDETTVSAGVRFRF
jgi:hypothetical protein